MAEVLYSGNIIKTKWKSHQMKEMIPPLLDQVSSYDDFQRLITAGVFLPYYRTQFNEKIHFFPDSIIWTAILPICSSVITGISFLIVPYWIML